MAQWISPGAERIRATVTRTLWLAWLIAAWVAWGRLHERFYLNDGSLDYVRAGAAAAAVVAGLWGTAALVRFVVSRLYGWGYTEMDQGRYDRAVVADVTRRQTIDRNLRR